MTNLEYEEKITDEIKRAVEAEDDGALLQSLNDYIGLLREMGRYDESYVIAERILDLSNRMGLKGSIPYATCMLNVATAYRAGGELQKSLEYYELAEETYKKALPPKSMLLASFYNNKALLYQEMGDIHNAITALEMALLISTDNDEKYEMAVTHANLANTFIATLDQEKAREEALIAVSMFRKQKVEDEHLAAALYALGLTMGSEGEDTLKEALDMVLKHSGKTEFYYRIKDALKLFSKGPGYGLRISRKLYEKYFKPALESELPGYVDKVAAALMGRGSDCFGFDDELSRDHDWGPDLCIFTDRETYELIGDKLNKIYENLPDEIDGAKRSKKVSTHKRHGVFVYEDFFKDLLTVYPLKKEDYAMVPDYAFSLTQNGEIFADPTGELGRIKKEIWENYPESLRYLRIAECASMFSQCGQYNLARVKERGDDITASIMMGDALKYAMKLAHYIAKVPLPHDKWLFMNIKNLPFGEELSHHLKDAKKKDSVLKLGKLLAGLLYKEGIISDSDDYLDHHKEEIIFKAGLVELSEEEIITKIVKTEYEAFDKVKNEGGRAYCQDDFYTFNIMRRSQYMLWNREMLMQYLYDFERELSYGHNLITEKYGRMMESTAPEKYAELKKNFPVISEDKQKLIDAVAEIQVGMMEEFAKEFPGLSDRARSIHAYEDDPFNTSYETYLRGEIGTYSDKMMELYATHVASFAKEGRNIAREIMENNVKLYGYDSLEAAEAKA